ncbi:phage tail tape measure protein [Burkholderia multivorans]|uniref:phage tail tape measure protein n=1 Tax=Burkholderia multivorans TaxID=87883 RepID=UPI001C26D586|nr:phage tail tape measure protein [Burkholderia multivorans]MBU9576603.1 phage tail tape measure protein [Burkholderia multivorans]
MKRDIALGIVIGGAVDGSLGRALSDTQSRITRLKQTAEQQRLWQRTIGGTQRLQGEFRKLHLSGDAAAEGIRKKIESNLTVLRQAGIEADNLDRAYQRLGRTARGLELQASGRERIGQGVAQGREAVGDALKLTATVAVPATISANYQAIVRDMAIKAGIAGTAREAQIGEQIAQSALATGMGRNELAQAINQLVGGGMDLERATTFAPLLAKFAVGQGSGSVDTARMIGALEQNAKISDPAQMQKALEAIAYLGKEGSFESSDMARWFPELLAEMQKIGITGQDSVNQLGAMLQVQMKVSGSPDQAANNLKNWFSKIGSSETKKRYEDAGIDYEAMMREAIGQGWSTMESSFVLARAYIEQVDPQRAQQVSVAAQRIGEERDPAKQQAMLQAFEATMKTGDLFADMQVKAALTAYLQNADLYRRLKQSAAQASGEIEQDLIARRETSKQIWAEVGQAWDEALRRIGDALRPVTDTVGQAVGSVGRALATLVEQAPMVVAGLATVAGGLVAIKGAKAAWNIGRGAFDLARGTLMADRIGTGKGLPGRLGNLASVLSGGAASAGAQPVFVTNWPGGGGGGLMDLLGRSGRGSPGTATTAGKAAGGIAASANNLGRFARVGNWLGKAGGRLGGALAIGTAAYQVYDTSKNATTRQEKAQGYGGAAGTLAGGLAGAKLGASVGALGGPIGIAIGSLLGGAIGSFAGDKLGGWLGKSLVAPTTPQPAPTLAATQHSAAASPPTAATNPPAPTVRPATTPAVKAPPVPQQLSFSPTLQITVKGDVKDPRQLANELMPHLKTLFEQFQQKAQRAAWYDGAHV